MRFDVLPLAEMGPDLLERWQQLQSGSEAFASPFFTPDFSQAVGECRDDLYLGVIEDQRQICGLLPFHRRAFGRGVPVGGGICDYQGFIGIAPASDHVAPMLSGFGLTALDYNHGLAEQDLLADNAYSWSRSPRADLRRGFAAWEEEVGRKGSALKTLARKERKLARDLGPLRFVASDPSAESWEAFIGWKREALRRIGVRFLARNWDALLLDNLRATRGHGLEGRLSTLYAGERLVAAHFGLVTKRAWHWWFPTYAPDTGNLSAGLVLLRHCIAQAACEGIAELDFGRGGERYKVEFSNNDRKLCEGSLERSLHPIGAARRLRKAVQRSCKVHLSEGQSAFLRRAANRLLGAGRL